MRDLSKDLETIEASFKDAPINALWMAYGVVPEAIRRAMKAEAEVERLKKVLEFYANNDNYKDGVLLSQDDFMGNGKVLLAQDEGKIARAALKGGDPA